MTTSILRRWSGELELRMTETVWGPVDTPDILLDLVGVSAAVDEDILDTGVCEELEGIFNQGGVCERE